MMTTKPSHKLSFRDRLSRLSFEQACKLMCPQGKHLLRVGAKRDVILKEDVYPRGDLSRVRFRSINGDAGTVATLTLKADARDRLHWNCTTCQEPCWHVVTMFSVLLENKTIL